MNEVPALGFPWDRLRARSMVVENMRGGQGRGRADRDVEELFALKGYAKLGNFRPVRGWMERA